MEELIKGSNKKIQGKIKIPGDKSISHRTVLLGSIAKGTTEVEGFLMGQDCLNTVDCVQKLGIDIIVHPSGKLTIYGKGLRGWKEPLEVLDAGNSGTTFRLLLGLLAGQSFHSIIKGDDSLSSRPMERVVKPLTLMGATIDGREKATKAPLAIRGGNLHSITYSSPVASAQVKSAVLLAGLYTDGITTVHEPEKSRDHTERMLKSFGAEISLQDKTSSVRGFPELEGQKIIVPGDISSAAFFMVAAAITPGSEILLEHVGINPTRKGIIDVLQKMGAKIHLVNQRTEAGEPVADIVIQYSQLHGVTIGGEEIPRLIDEIPILAVAAGFAEGETVIKDAGELKVKETNRIDAITSQLALMGMDIIPQKDGMIIRGEGDRVLKGAMVNSFFDHRIAMALAVAGTRAQGETVIKHGECVNISFPEFFHLLRAFAH
ncbi:MAG: 3-phosphoshikimate 1-carboxyvinyltransferase [Dehalobacterium sp.]|jgi:3-phosphoshikimate 1-carboxyvinyltransferase